MDVSHRRTLLPFACEVVAGVPESGHCGNYRAALRAGSGRSGFQPSRRAITVASVCMRYLMSRLGPPPKCGPSPPRPSRSFNRAERHCGSGHASSTRWRQRWGETGLSGSEPAYAASGHLSEFLSLAGCRPGSCCRGAAVSSREGFVGSEAMTSPCSEHPALSLTFRSPSGLYYGEMRRFRGAATIAV